MRDFWKNAAALICRSSDSAEKFNEGNTIICRMNAGKNVG
jgi:hypothetical protein